MAVGNPQWGECRKGGVFLRLPQPAAPSVVLAVTQCVPQNRRRWNELTCRWWINDSHIELVEEILQAHYPG